tara:strand:- start:1245 stop:1499 length:255 start_codon:yes stop_codon:yes gene_type:complete
MDENTRVTLSEIDIPFIDIVKLLVKWSFASIPAIIVVSLVLFLLGFIGFSLYHILLDAGFFLVFLITILIPIGILLTIYSLTRE